MSPDALAFKIRTRAHWEAIDLGLALVQTYWRKLYAAWLVIALPAVFSALALTYLLKDSDNNILYGMGLFWWLKPLYDRVFLHVLSRAVFGETLGWRGVLRAIPGLLRHTGLLRALTWGRFSPQRSFKLPIWQLEGVTGRTRSRRLRSLKGEGAVRLIFVCSAFEMILISGMLGFIFMMLPPEFVPSRLESLSEYFAADKELLWLHAIYSFVYLLAISVIEPFYVAAGFALYLNQRTKLEGWDIELGFRTLAARLEARQTPS